MCIPIDFELSGAVHKAAEEGEKVQVDRYTDITRGEGLGSRPKKMYGERLGDGVEYHLMSPTPRR